MTVYNPSPWGPIPQFFDNNGLELTGGKLFTYAAGGTTKINSYTTQAGTANVNPVVLNTRGECNLWLTPGTAYKFVLAPSTDTDPPTNAFWTVDNVNAATPGSFTGDSGSGGIQGQVPAPGSGTAAANDYLRADGTWAPLIVTPPASAIDVHQAGYLGAPQRSVTANDSLALTDAGGALYHNSASAHNLTITKDAAAGWTAAQTTVIILINPTTGGVWSLVPDTGVSLFGPTAFNTSGTRALAANGQATLTRIATNTWNVVGAGIS